MHLKTGFQVGNSIFSLHSYVHLYYFIFNIVCIFILILNHFDTFSLLMFFFLLLCLLHNIVICIMCYRWQCLLSFILLLVTIQYIITARKSHYIENIWYVIFELKERTIFDRCFFGAFLVCSFHSLFLWCCAVFG